MAKSSADDVELRRACQAEVASDKHKVVMCIRCYKSPGSRGKPSARQAMAKPRILAICSTSFSLLYSPSSIIHHGIGSNFTFYLHSSFMHHPSTCMHACMLILLIFIHRCIVIFSYICICSMRLSIIFWRYQMMILLYSLLPLKLYCYWHHAIMHACSQRESAEDKSFSSSNERKRKWRWCWGNFNFSYPTTS